MTSCATATPCRARRKCGTKCATISCVFRSCSFTFLLLSGDAPHPASLLSRSASAPPSRSLTRLSCRRCHFFYLLLFVISFICHFFYLFVISFIVPLAHTSCRRCRHSSHARSLRAFAPLPPLVSPSLFSLSLSFICLDTGLHAGGFRIRDGVHPAQKCRQRWAEK